MRFEGGERRRRKREGETESASVSGREQRRQSHQVRSQIQQRLLENSVKTQLRKRHRSVMK